ncbi:MAG: hypothetical protein IGS48_18095 [Oscillatoriales cyanobacterium C42_A2020_001]|nr:hypothetical protein [Leptolyngbyaceae cyanobacterium C42_A2020_001]
MGSIPPKPLPKRPKLPAVTARPGPISRVASPATSRVRGSHWNLVWAIALMGCAAGGVVGLGWVGSQLIINPQSVRWVNQWVPGWNVAKENHQLAKSLQEIRAELRQQGKLSGEFLALGKNLSFLDGRTPTADWLLPVIQPAPNCLTNCDRIVELRVYQTATNPGRSLTTKERYYLVSQLATPGLEESFAIAPLVEANSENQGSSRALPLTQLSRYEGTVPKRGIWLNLSGTRTRGDEAIAYGQILYYHPHTQHLSAKLQWTSPTGEEPIWKEVTGADTPELIVNQTIGMEPQFEIYQVKSHNFIHSPVQLEPISIAEPALNDSQYDSALLLARSRLWSTSLLWLQSLKQRSPNHWSPTVQAQMDLIRWHAQTTQNQAEGSWASPGQQILANMIDGRWERALTVFKSSAEASQEAIELLKTDRGRLENRIKASLRVNPNKMEVKIWGALLMTAQQTPTAAIAWLKKLPNTSAQDMAYIQTFTQRLDPNFPGLPSAQQHLEPNFKRHINR